MELTHHMHINYKDKPKPGFSHLLLLLDQGGIIILGRNRMDLEDLKAQGMPGQSGLLCLSPRIKNWIQVT